MDSLGFMQKFAQELRKKLLNRAVVDLMIRKLGKRGIRVPKNRKVAFAKWIESGASDCFAISGRKGTSNSLASLEITRRDARRLNAMVLRRTPGIVTIAAEITTRRIARPYLDHETIESVRAATGYAEVAARLGHSPMDPADIASLENERAKLLRKYGDSFGAEYGWAAPAFKSSRPRFADIERFVGLDHLRPYYKMASHGVHANPKGVLFQLGNPRIDTLLMAGPTNFGLADPGQTTALSLAQLTAALVQLAPLIEHQLTLAAMNLIAKDAAKAFVGVQLGIEKAEERIQAKARREAAH
jgi:hypothetical protein